MVIASDGPSPLPPFLRLGLATHQPSRGHHPQSLPGPSFHDPRTLHVLKSHPERAAPLPAALVINNMLSAPTLPFILQPATPPHFVALESWTISAPICLRVGPNWKIP